MMLGARGQSAWRKNVGERASYAGFANYLLFQQMQREDLRELTLLIEE